MSDYRQTRPNTRYEIPFEECPNCGQYDYRRIETRDEVNPLIVLFRLGFAIPLKLVGEDFKVIPDREWRFYKNQCKNCFYEDDNK